MMDGSSQLCARARFWVSLRLDDELSELEGALLDAHLSRCADCSEFAASAVTFSETLRTAPLEVGDPVRVHLPHASLRPLLAFAAVVVVVAAAITGGLVRGAASHDAAPAASRAVAVVASVETPDQIRRLRRTALLDRYVPRDFFTDPA
jgi:hypothetical protein